VVVVVGVGLVGLVESELVQLVVSTVRVGSESEEGRPIERQQRFGNWLVGMKEEEREEEREEDSYCNNEYY
jgi:hypothetical protein